MSSIDNLTARVRANAGCIEQIIRVGKEYGIEYRSDAQKYFEWSHGQFLKFQNPEEAFELFTWWMDHPDSPLNPANA